MKKLLFGTGGPPLSAPTRKPWDGVKEIKKLGLGCMELEFVYGVRLRPDDAEMTGRLASENSVVLSAHAPYYINLNSREQVKVDASVERILNTARIGSRAGAFSITFHPAFYSGTAKDRVYAVVRSHLKRIVNTLKQEKIRLWVSPEITGKASQFGDVDELARLSSELDMVRPCIDFAHLYARSRGRINSYKAFSGVLDKLERTAGSGALKQMHIHMSGIEFTDKGEKRHEPLQDSKIDYRALLRALKDYDCTGVVICESPLLEKDALLMKHAYDWL